VIDDAGLVELFRELRDELAPVGDRYDATAAIDDIGNDLAGNDRLSSAGRHDQQRVASPCDFLDEAVDRALLIVAKDRPGRGDGAHGSRSSSSTSALLAISFRVAVTKSLSVVKSGLGGDALISTSGVVNSALEIAPCRALRAAP
jgi:hypothetical protein